MTEAGNMGDTAQPGQGPRAADMGDGALPPAAAEDGGRRPQPQREFCPLVACGQQHSARGGLAPAILDLDGECGLHTGPWLGSADGHGQRGTGFL